MNLCSCMMGGMVKPSREASRLVWVVRASRPSRQAPREGLAVLGPPSCEEQLVVQVNLPRVPVLTRNGVGALAPILGPSFATCAVCVHLLAFIIKIVLCP